MAARQRLLATTGLLMLMVLAAGCSRGPTLSPLSDDAVIVAFGDSLTRGTGVDPRQSYPAVLGRLIHRRVINAGVPGEETAAGLARLPRVVAQYHPTLVVLCHGGNDMLRRHSIDRTRDNLAAMVRLLQGDGVQVVLIGVPKPGLFPETASIYRIVADDTEVPLVDDTLASLESDRRYKSDYVHLNAAGYRRLAESVRNLLADRGALP